MADGNFLNDLSSGIFTRLGQLRDEQKQKDESRRSETLQVLSGLADKVDPESLPVLMRAIGDTAGIKGKMRKFWDAFSGMPDRSIEDQIGTKLRDITQMTMGSRQAKNTRAGGDLARLFQPQNDQQRMNQAGRLQEESDLSNRVVFRDPYSEDVEKTKARYGAQYQNQLTLLEDRQRHSNEMQQEKFRLQGVQDQMRFYQKANLVKQRLMDSYLGSGQARTPQEASLMADTYITGKAEADLDNVLAGTALRNALTGKAQTEASQVKALGGKPSDVRAEREFSQKQYKDAADIYNTWSTARDRAREFTPNIKAAENALTGMVSTIGGKFDPTTRSFMMPEGIAPSRRASAALQDYLKMLSEESNVKAQMQSSFKRLQGMPEYVRKMGQSEWDDIELKSGIAPGRGVRRQGEAPSAPIRPSKPLPRAGLTTGTVAKPVINIPSRPDRAYQPNEIIRMGKYKYRIMDVAPDGTATGRIIK